MPIDAQAPFALDQQSKTADAVSDLRRRVRKVEGGTPMVQAGSGPPTSTPRDGTLYVDVVNLRLYACANGAWRYAALT